MVLAGLRDLDSEQAVEAERGRLVGGRDADRLELAHAGTILRNGRPSFEGFHGGRPKGPAQRVLFPYDGCGFTNS
jgi:hypothetical protein